MKTHIKLTTEESELILAPINCSMFRGYKYIVDDKEVIRTLLTTSQTSDFVWIVEAIQDIEKELCE